MDFSDFDEGTVITLRNIGPDEPFGGPGFDPADPGSTGLVMQFMVGAADNGQYIPGTGAVAQGFLDELGDAITDNPELPGTPDNWRGVSLNEEVSERLCLSIEDDAIADVLDCTEGNEGDDAAGPRAAILGTVQVLSFTAFESPGDQIGNYNETKQWADDISEIIAFEDTEQWNIYNFTADAHPIHLHLVLFQVIERAMINGDLSGETGPWTEINLPNNGLEPWEINSLKDTVTAYPEEVTKIKAYFDIAGLYVWHCHILSHEDNEMMRAYWVGNPPAPAP